MEPRVNNIASVFAYIANGKGLKVNNEYIYMT